MGFLGKVGLGEEYSKLMGLVTGAPTRIIMILIRNYSTVTAPIIFVLNNLVDYTRGPQTF